MAAPHEDGSPCDDTVHPLPHPTQLIVHTEDIAYKDDKSIIGKTSLSTSSGVEKPSEVNIIQLNDKVLDVFVQYFMEKGQIITIHNYSPCECGFVFMDEEILSLWCRSASMDIHAGNIAGGPTQRSSRRKSLISLDPFHRLLCAQCGKEVNPKLYVMKHETLRREDDHPLASTVAGDGIHVQHTAMEEANYLSPFVLRMELEEALMRLGEGLGEVDYLYRQRPDLLWNILWYSTRFSLPSGCFLQNAGSHEYTRGDHTFPILIGWRKEVVEAKSKRVLQGMPGDLLEVADLVPFCSESELKLVMGGVLSNLDGSPAGMRLALLHLAQCESIHVAAQEMKLSIARLLYTSMLGLALHFAHFAVYDKKRPELHRDLSQVVHTLSASCVVYFTLHVRVFG
jgi:hypothetical protein